jgi:hypothetical protein
MENTVIVLRQLVTANLTGHQLTYITETNKETIQSFT